MFRQIHRAARRCDCGVYSSKEAGHGGSVSQSGHWATWLADQPELHLRRLNLQKAVRLSE